MKIIRIIFILLPFLSGAQTTYTLLSSCDTDGECNWNNGTSWVGGVAPNGGTPVNGDIIVIPEGTRVEVQGGGNKTSITNLVILKVYGTIDVTTSSARLELLNTGSLIQLHSNAQILGGGASNRLAIGGTSINGAAINSLTYPNELSVDNIDGGGCAVQGDCADSDPLPVELTSFDASSDVDGIGLVWHTVSEKNNDYFSVERSENGADFYEIGRVQGNGTTDIAQVYSFTDHSPISKIEYYRLRQVDFDGQFEIHKTVVGYTDKLSSQVAIEIYPNPASEKVTLKTVQPVMYNFIRLVDQSGKIVADFDTKTDGLRLERDLPKLRGGIYFIKYEATSGVSGTQKLMIR